MLTWSVESSRRKCTFCLQSKWHCVNFLAAVLCLASWADSNSTSQCPESTSRPADIHSYRHKWSSSFDQLFYRATQPLCATRAAVDIHRMWWVFPSCIDHSWYSVCTDHSNIWECCVSDRQTHSPIQRTKTLCPRRVWSCALKSWEFELESSWLSHFSSVLTYLVVDMADCLATASVAESFSIPILLPEKIISENQNLAIVAESQPIS